MKQKKIKTNIKKSKIYFNKPNNNLSIGIRILNLNNVKLHFGNKRNMLVEFNFSFINLTHCNSFLSNFFFTNSIIKQFFNLFKFMIQAIN